MTYDEKSLTKRIMTCLASSTNEAELLQNIGTQLFPDRWSQSGALIGRGTRPRLVATFGFDENARSSLLNYLHLEPFGQVLREGRPITFLDAEDFLYWNPHWTSSEVEAKPSLLIPIEVLSEPTVVWLRFEREVFPDSFRGLDRVVDLLGHAVNLLTTKRFIDVGADYLSRMQLNLRELEVARLVAEGATNYQVAKALHISESWVKKLLQQVFLKLGISSRRELESLREQIKAA